MSAKLKKRLYKSKNKLQKLEKLELKDVVCSICQSIVIEPVTLPCFHFFCQRCFNGTIENNALCCPLCRLRIGSWLRKTTKQNNFVNVELWDYIKSKFSNEINTKLNGEDINLPEDKPILRLSAPGEIRSEYEAELLKIRAERLQIEQKQIEETTLLIKKIQQEEQEAQKKYLERLKEDEMLAQQIQKQEEKPYVQQAKKLIHRSSKPKLKPTKIDEYLARIEAPLGIDNSPLLTDDNTSTDESTPKTLMARTNSRPSPELVPSYGKVLKNITDKKIKVPSNFWNKENGEKDRDKEQQNCSQSGTKEKKAVIKSLPVSLPLPVSMPLPGSVQLPVSVALPSAGILQHKSHMSDRNFETGSADSMRQELCFFKPIEKTSTTSYKTTKILPMRVPSIRAETKSKLSTCDVKPNRAQYIEGLCKLRQLSLSKSLPSAFVIALKILRVKKEINAREVNKSQAVKRRAPDVTPTKKIVNNKKTLKVPNNSELSLDTNLRRTRSMGSISKEENETTPKKAKIEMRKSNSERKPYLRSDSKRSCAKKRIDSPLNDNKVNLAVKNLSSPLKNCDVKKILQDQLRIEKIIEQDKKDLELARQMDAELNGRRQLRRAPGKRQVTLNYALRPAKKMKA